MLHKLVDVIIIIYSPDSVSFNSRNHKSLSTKCTKFFAIDEWHAYTDVYETCSVNNIGKIISDNIVYAHL